MKSADAISPDDRASRRRLSRLAREKFTKARIAEKQYGRQLRQVARQVGHITKGMVDPSGAIDFNSITATLQQYANILKPWSKSVALRMLSDVYNRDAKAWAQHGDEMGRALREEIETAPTGTVMQALLDSQVDLITSLPREAAQRVQKLATESRITGMRASELVSKILETGDVTLSRAQLIARTETARAASALTEARAKHVGSEGYIWRTAEDSDVRADHKKLNGKFIRWDDPPIADSHANVRAHAGTIYNCRCYSEPVIPD